MRSLGKATAAIPLRAVPIVFAQAIDPVGAGIISSLARPAAM
jgi:hypothetical protein